MPLPAEATTQLVRLRGGLLTPAEAVAWADGWILRLPDLPAALVDLSLSRAHVEEIFTALHRLACPEMTPVAFQTLCRTLLGGLREGRWTLSQENSILWRVHYDDVHGGRKFQGEKPEGLYLFHESESLILDGYEDRTLDELRAEVERFMAGFA